MSDHILSQDDGHVRILHIHRPDKKNALTRAMYTALSEGLEDASTNASVRVVIIKGEAGVFTAGNDLMDFMQEPPSIGAEPMPPVERFMRALMACTKPVIASVDGLAIGIGTTLLLHCDLVYCSENARFKTPFVDLALAPEFGSSQLLPGRVGRALAGELLLLGTEWDYQRAVEKNLVTAHIAASDLDARVLNLAQDLAGKAPAAVRQAKALMAMEPEPLLDRIVREGEAFTELLRSPEFQEAATAFMERRAPDFSKFNA